MNISNTFKKIAGAVATSAILAGAPSVATASSINNQEMSHQEALKQQEINFNRMAEVNAGQINSKLKSIGLPNIKIVRPSMRTKCMGVDFAVVLEKNNKLLFEANCQHFDFSNKYSFDEKFFGKIAGYLSVTVNPVSKEETKTNNIKEIEQEVLLEAEFDEAADSFMSKYGVILDERTNGAGISEVCFFKKDKKTPLSQACFQQDTKSVLVRFIKGSFHLDIVNKDNTTEKAIGTPVFSPSTGEIVKIDIK